MKMTDLNENDSKNQIDQGMKLYLKKAHKKFNPIHHRFLNYLPTRIKCLVNKKNVKEILRNFLKRKNSWNFEIPSGSSYNNLRKIENFLLNFYKIHD